MRKRLLFVLLFVSFGLAAMWGQEVSEKEAQVRAQKFVNSHYGRKGGGSELKSLGQVNGLYVFNMNDKGGFVIVSNDERATDILGYNESGQFDPDNMPDNMRAWLQGYADEIAWAQKNIKEVSETNTKTRARTRAHATTDIDPLVTTKWDQQKPYKYYCTPLGLNYNIATGCAATAMAQVMYTTEKNTAKKAFIETLNENEEYTEEEFKNYFKTYTTTTTHEIPKYNWTGNGTTYQLGPIAAGSVIKWGKMTDTYNTKQTTAEESVDAVATLMKYCGYSIKMSYGSSSSAYTSDIALALKNYFGYSETTTHLLRYKYSYTDWVDMIYHELSQGRPVLYAGQAFDNGHAFICDGYQYDLENNIDLFHINWGWSGSSDGYFVLSVLNPDEQGTGGSATNSAYTFGQEAIVGIQKDGGTGKVYNMKPLESVSISINSVSLSHSFIALGESVNATISVTNNNSDAYDGEICLYSNNSRCVGKIFQIPAGATQDCIITYTPSEVGSYSIDARYPLLQGSYGTGTSSISSASLTVTDLTPSNLTATAITPTTATIGWTNVGAATKWNLRSRTANVTIEDFNDLETFDSNNSGLRLVKFGDSQNTLKISPNGGINNSKCLISPSFENGTDLDPYGGLRTPLIKLNGSISFYAWGEGEKFWIFLSLDGSNYTSFTDIISTTNVQTQYSFDLSQYIGQYADQSGYIAIIHCESSGHTSDSYLYIDNVCITQPIGEWTKTNEVTSPYILNGLSPETGYEVQVQAVKNDGGKWSVPVVFKSKASTDPFDLENGNNNVGLIEGWNTYTTTVTLKDRTLYKDGDWNTICLPFNVSDGNANDNITFSGTPLAGATVMELDVTGSYTNPTSLASDGTLYLNFKNATEIVAGTPYIIKWASGDNLVNPVFEGVTIDKTMHDVTSTDGKVTFKGTYESQSFTSENTSILFVGGNNTLYYPKSGASIGSQRAYFQIGSGNSSIRAFSLNFGDNEVTGISNASIKNDTINWYDLSGRKLNGKPVKKGVYVQNGKKVVIK